MKKRILFVDDEPLVLQGLQRSTHPMRNEWDMNFTDSAEKALQFMAETPPHVIVSDMRMPGMNGAELLARVRELSADTVRVMLTGNAEFQIAVDAVNQGHVFQFLRKPCEGEQLIQSLNLAIHQHQLQSAERELLLAQLRHSEKLALIGQLAAGINHDLNNILTVILTLTQLSANKGEEGKPMLRIQEAALRAAELTRELNAFSRNGEAADLAPLQLGDVVKSGVCIIQPMLKRQINLRVEIEPGLPAVHGNAGKLQQALMNLVINARDAAPRGSEVLIRAHVCHRTHEAAAPGGPRAGTFVCLSVCDMGCGIAAETQQRLCEPFFTTKAPGKGTGLGLFMVKNILQQHHGWMEVESQVGAGTTFRLFLPTAVGVTAHGVGS